MKFQLRAASVALCLLAAGGLSAVSASGKSPSASSAHHHKSHKKAAPATVVSSSHKSAHARRLAAQQQAIHARKHALLAKQNSVHARQNALHAKRLASKQKAAWRAHVAKVRELSPHDRRALRQHNQRFAEQTALHEEHVAVIAKHNKRAAMLAAHEQKLAAKRAQAREARGAQSAHARRLAAKQAAMAHDTAVSRNLKARRQAAAVATHSHKWAAQQNMRDRRTAAEQATQDRKARIARAAQANATRTAHEQHLTAIQTAHEQHLAAIQAVHDRRLAAMQAIHDRRVNSAQSGHDRRVAAALAEHNRRVAAARAAYNNKMAAHNARIARAAALHQSRLVAHNARIAAQHSHFVATHGDDSGGRSIRFWQTNVANVPVKVITVDLNDPNVKVSAVMARNGDGTSEPFKQMINRANPNVAVTGTFFSLDNLKPVGDIVIGGSLVHFGGMGTALCVTPGNKADMVSCQWGRHHDWSAYDFVCACGPRLLLDHRVVLDPRAERFHDQHMLAPNSRIAVGITSGNKLVFAMTRDSIYLGRLARVMRGLGCSEAMNLDAGTSTGFYYNGTTLARPGRKLTNMIVVYGRKERYERALDQLVPPPYRRADRGAEQHPSVLARN